ncbi:MAG TPA: MFS transporter [Lacunisphaera sp.]|nr:MFS transporter [Lacunisphaera sp.]
MPNPAGPAGTLALIPPTRARHWVVVFAVTLAVIQYIDRVCIAKAAPLISRDLALSKEQMGWVFSAFTLAYALFEVPTGYWGDRIGPRRILLRVVLWSSFFTAATGWVFNQLSLVVVRFLFGAGEAGCFPNLTKAFSYWLPPAERLRTQAVMWTSTRWGGAITPAVVFLVLGVVNWRVAFLVFGLVGVVWAVAFARWFRDNPREHPAVNAVEAALLPVTAGGGDHFALPWDKLLRSRSVWLLCGQYFAASYAWYFFITWFPTYLLEVHQLDLTLKSALLAGLPLFLGGCGMLVIGAVGPALQRWAGSAGLACRLTGVVGFAGAGACLVAATRFQQPMLAVAAIAGASFCNDLTVPGAWTGCMNVGGRYVGTLSGLMNMVGNLGGFFSPVVLGYVVGRTGDWNLTFYVTAGVYALGALCWWFLDPVTPLEQQVKS